MLYIIVKTQFNASLLKELQYDTELWNIPDDTSFDNLPSLKGITASYSDGGKQPENTEVYIPDYNRVSELNNYEQSKEIVYHNMYKLMPFYDAKEIIRDGNKIPANHDLATKIIDYVIPL